MGKSKIYKTLSGFNHIKWKTAFKGIFVGFISGLLVVFYRLGIEYGTTIAIKSYAYLKIHPYLIIIWIIIAILIGLFVSWLIKLEPMAIGSGIPQIEGVVLFGLKMKWYSIMFVRFIAGFLCSFFGVSLGREGPSIQIGASTGQAIAKKMKTSQIEENYLITGGAAAGLSAAFGAPLSGIIFALEEVHRSFSPIILLCATTASLTSDFVAEYFFGLKPILDFTTIKQLPLNLYWFLIVVGILAGILGVLFNKSLLGIQKLYCKIPKLSRPIIALLIAIPCGIFFPLTLGSGQDLIAFAENAQSGVLFLLTLLIVKLLFTSTSFGSDIPGGIFMPILSVGTIGGAILAILLSNLGLPTQYIATFSVCAMAGALASSVKAPITAILLTAEMSGSLVHMLPISICAFIALLVSDLLKTRPIYEALLEQFVHEDGKNVSIQEHGSLIELPIEYGSNLANKKISEIKWPKESLVVGIRRGEKEFLPHGDSKILPGDYIIILSEKESIRKNIASLCYVEN